MARAARDARRFSETVHAVIVGISSYSGTGLPDLPACEPEAAEVADALASPRTCGVPPSQIHLIPDAEASRRSICDVLARVAVGATPDDILMFYYAGHGENAGEGFVLRTGPQDIDPQLGVSREDIVSAIGNTSARGVILILDCCGGAAFAEKAPDFFRALAGHDFRLLVSASRAGQSSWELQDYGSLFSRRLLRILRGDDRLDDSGMIFFNDLFEYLYAGVVSDARREFGESKKQTPVFAGSYAGDPLLFLNRDVTLSQVRVRASRITPDVLRRRVLAAVASVVVPVVLLMTGYWAFLDSHHYLEIRGDNLTLVHGYPGLSGFGLPKDEWIYSEGPANLLADSSLQPGRPLVFDRQVSPEAKLIEILNPPARARIHLWLNDRPAAHDDLMRAAAKRAPTKADDLEFLPELVGTADRKQLESLAADASSDTPIEVVLALKTIDPSAAIAVFRASPAARNLGSQLDLLSKWEGSCTPQVQEWLDALAADHQASLAFPALVMTILRTKGCALQTESAIDVPDRYVRDALYALRLTNKAGTEELRQTMDGMLANADSTIRAHPEHLGRLAAYWRYLGHGSCGSWLLDPGWSLAPDSLLDAGVAVARDCPDWKFEARTMPGEITLVVHQGESLETVLARYPLNQTLGAGVTNAVNAMLDGKAEGSESALRAILGATENPDTRMYVAAKLRYLGARGDGALSYRLSNRSDLDRELLRWLASSDPARASMECANLILAGHVDSALLWTLALIEIGEPDRRRLLQFASTQLELPRTIIRSLIGPPDVAAQLLNSPDPTERGYAAEYILARPDYASVFAQAKRMSKRADVLLVRADARMRRLAAIEAQLASTPDFALSWRIARMDLVEMDDGMALAFQRFLDRGRRRALAGP